MEQILKWFIRSLGAVYVRAGAGTQHKILTVVRAGDTLPWFATAANGWHATEVNGKAGWITPKYTEVK